MLPPILCEILQLYLLVLLVRIVLTWFPIQEGTMLGTVSHALGVVTDPILRPVRRLIPAVSFGGTAIDLSPILVFLVFEILLRIFC